MSDTWIDISSVASAKPLALGLVGALVAYKLLSSRRRSADGIPMIPYTLPWVGSALTMGKNPDAFMREAEERFGPMFRMMLLGSEDIFVVSPSLISAIYRDPTTFVFTPFRVEMSQYVFGLTAFAAETSTLGDYAHMHHIQLSPKEVPNILRRFTTVLQKRLQEIIPAGSPNSKEPATTTIALQDLLLPVSFHAVSKAIFGSGLPSDEMYPSFVRFNRDFHLLAAKVPRFITGGASKAWDVLNDDLVKYLEGPHADASELVLEGIRIGKETGWGPEQTARVLGTTIWASEANTIWAVYWLIAAPLTQPEGLGPLIAEIDASRSKYLEEHPGTEIDLLNDPDATYDWISSASANLPLLTAMIQEVLRLYSSVLSKRRVTRPTTLGGHPLEKDQDVLVVIRAVHMDEEIHEDATSWRPERYLKDADNANGGGSAKKYMKDGKSVPNHSMPWGGGVSMCEGRHLAMGELKAFAIILLTFFELEVDAGTKLPTMNTTRMGLGLFHATSDIDVRIKRRVL